MICATIVMIDCVTEYLCLLKKKVNTTKQPLSLWEQEKHCLFNATVMYQGRELLFFLKCNRD